MAKAARALLAVPGPKLTSNDCFQRGGRHAGHSSICFKRETMRMLKAYFERQLKNDKAVLSEVRTTP